MKLVCKPLMNGIMAYWTEVADAARYNVRLYINDCVISRRINERTELYHTFSGLAAIDGTTGHAIRAAAVASSGWGHVEPQHSGLDYYVQVTAEDRNGNALSVSEKVKARVREF